MIVPGMLVCSSFLISVCMFIVSKALLISSATVIVRAGGAIWLNPLRVCVLYISGYVRKKALLQCLQLLRGGIWACKRCPCLCLCWVLGWGVC